MAGGEANHAPDDSRVHPSSAFSSLPTEARCLVSGVLTVGNPNSESCQGDAIHDKDARKEAHLLKGSPRLEGAPSRHPDQEIALKWKRPRLQPSPQHHQLKLSS